MLMVYMMHTIIHIFSYDYFSVVKLPKIFSLIKAPGYNTINIFNIRSLGFFIQNNHVFLLIVLSPSIFLHPSVNLQNSHHYFSLTAY